MLINRGFDKISRGEGGGLIDIIGLLLKIQIHKKKIDTLIYNSI